MCLALSPSRQPSGSLLPSLCPKKNPAPNYELGASFSSFCHLPLTACLSFPPLSAVSFGYLFFFSSSPPPPSLLLSTCFFLGYFAFLLVLRWFSSCSFPALASLILFSDLPRALAPIAFVDCSFWFVAGNVAIVAYTDLGNHSVAGEFQFRAIVHGSLPGLNWMNERSVNPEIWKSQPWLFQRNGISKCPIIEIHALKNYSASLSINLLVLLMAYFVLRYHKTSKKLSQIIFQGERLKLISSRLDRYFYRPPPPRFSMPATFHSWGQRLSRISRGIIYSIRHGSSLLLAFLIDRPDGVSQCLMNYLSLREDRRNEKRAREYD